MQEHASALIVLLFIHQLHGGKEKGGFVLWWIIDRPSIVCLFVIITKDNWQFSDVFCEEEQLPLFWLFFFFLALRSEGARVCFIYVFLFPFPSFDNNGSRVNTRVSSVGCRKPGSRTSVLKIPWFMIWRSMISRDSLLTIKKKVCRGSGQRSRSEILLDGRVIIRLCLKSTLWIIYMLFSRSLFNLVIQRTFRDIPCIRRVLAIFLLGWSIMRKKERRRGAYNVVGLGWNPLSGRWIGWCKQASR